MRCNIVFIKKHYFLQLNERNYKSKNKVINKIKIKVISTFLKHLERIGTNIKYD